MDIEEIIEPLFSYDSKELKSDINCQNGDICYVANSLVSKSDVIVTQSNEKMTQITESGKSIINMDDLDNEGLNGMINYVDALLKNNKLSDRDKWDHVYFVINSKLERRNQKG